MLAPNTELALRKYEEADEEERDEFLARTTEALREIATEMQVLVRDGGGKGDVAGDVLVIIENYLT